MRIGSEEHKQLFCRSFISTHEAYEPRELPWPELDGVSLAHLRSLPIWGTALQVESNAGVMVSGFAKTLRDPLIREAVALQGVEEERHARLIATMVERYQLSAHAEPPSPSLTERAFIEFGCGECIDSFFGFGFFRLVREAGLMPDALLAIFHRVLAEEARHIVFFVNWIAYERAGRSRGGAMLHASATGLAYARGMLNIVKTAAAAGGNAAALPSDGALDVFAHLTVPKFLAACMAENDAHMAAFDARLLRPRLMPTLARSTVGIALAARLIDTLVNRPLISSDGH